MRQCHNDRFQWQRDEPEIFKDAQNPLWFNLTDPISINSAKNDHRVVYTFRPKCQLECISNASIQSPINNYILLLVHRKKNQGNIFAGKLVSLD